MSSSELPVIMPTFAVGYPDSWFRDRYGSRGAKVHAVADAKGYRGERRQALCGVEVSVSRDDFERSGHPQCRRCVHHTERRRNGLPEGS